MSAATVDATIAEHRALGLPTSAQQVQTLLTLFAGALLTLVTGPPEAATRESTLTLARCLVRGVLDTLPGAAGPSPH